MAFVVLIICSACGLLDYFDPTKSDGAFWQVIVCIVIVLFFSIGFGVILCKFFFVGVIALGFCCGFLLGTLLYTLVFI